MYKWVGHALEGKNKLYRAASCKADQTLYMLQANSFLQWAIPLPIATFPNSKSISKQFT
jgi:urease accessory protein UreH